MNICEPQTYRLKMISSVALILINIVLVFGAPSQHEIVPMRYWVTRMPISGGNYDHDFIYNITKYLNSKSEFQGFISFNKDRRDMYRSKFILIRSREHALMEDFNKPLIIWGLDNSAKFRKIIAPNYLTFVQIDAMDDPILEVVDYALEGLHYMHTIFYYKNAGNQPPTEDQIYQLFEWCWNKNMPNVVLIFQTFKYGSVEDLSPTTYENKVFVYRPYPKLTIVDCSNDLNNFNQIVFEKFSDVKGHTFYTPVFDYMPSVFLLPPGGCKGKTACKETITGGSGRLYNEYIRKINGTLHIDYKMDFNHSHYAVLLRSLVTNKTIDIGAVPLKQDFFFRTNLTGSFPIAQTNACLIVPFIENVPLDHIIYHALKPNVWKLLFTLSLIYILVQMTITYFQNLMTHGSALKALALTLSEAQFQHCYLLVQQPISFMPLQKQTWLYKNFFVFILVCKLVVYNFYLASLTSLLNTTPLGHQIETVEDFLRTNLQIMVTAFEKGAYFDTSAIPIALESRLKVVRTRELNKHRNSLNTSYAYVATSGLWSVMSFKQHFLQRTRLRIASSKLCTPPTFVKFPVQADSPIIYSLDEFFSATIESGLSDYWAELSIEETEQFNLITVDDDNFNCWEPLSFEFFGRPFKICLTIWLLSFLCFILEIVWHKITQRKLKK